MNDVMQVSNTFYFTFGVDQEVLKNGLMIRNVAPATEDRGGTTDPSTYGCYAENIS